MLAFTHELVKLGEESPRSRNPVAESIPEFPGKDLERRGPSIIPVSPQRGPPQAYPGKYGTPREQRLRF